VASTAASTVASEVASKVAFTATSMAASAVTSMATFVATSMATSMATSEVASVVSSKAAELRQLFANQTGASAKPTSEDLLVEYISNFLHYSSFTVHYLPRMHIRLDSVGRFATLMSLVGLKGSLDSTYYSIYFY
jgi:hypothetical protein